MNVIQRLAAAISKEHHPLRRRIIVVVPSSRGNAAGLLPMLVIDLTPQRDRMNQTASTAPPAATHCPIAVIQSVTLGP
jgi:hypothetical protein